MKYPPSCSGIQSILGDCLSGDLKLPAVLSTNSTTGSGPNGFI